ncbi:methyl-accepting chemotaxis protein [Tepidimicrobium xylanilyticum]|uniref:Methyl-accepting chemotaxis protein n=1 Tax=Tepidimicrobium xylanilyticum TaxID=1123352 RepID=A0A1H2RK25_9FIRM|nr:methyl-accepting chemotaxis protein [Tepidimicrobium xylanilyticum]GMG95414.1 hypothetical protein EN5CB1_02400 [Tepidimicrobium xylanilyticum]SDW18989.1 Methyl-accepting chemotaxis protein [Tepidimicrobium xylanilyticum]
MNVKSKNGIALLFITIFVTMGISYYLASIIDELIGVLGLFALMALLSSIVLYKGLTKRVVNHIKRYVNIFKSMDFTSDGVKFIPEYMKRELDVLADSIRNNLKTQVEISTRLFDICEKLNSVSMDSLNSAALIASSVDIVDKNTLEQSNMLIDASSTATEIVHSLEKIEKEITDKSQFISESITTAQESMKNANIIGKRIRQSKDMTEKTLEQILRLNSYSDEIVNLIDLINSISKETSMLSLNASIEAARAGQEGKGFAIVAMEIGKLAEETKKASSRIEEVIQNLKGHISSSKGFMEDVMEYMEENWEVMLDISKEFESIIERLNKGKYSLEEITDVIERNNSAIIRVSENIEQVSSFSQEISSQIAETALETSEQNSRAEFLRKMAEDIKKQVFDMQQFVVGNVMEEIMLKQAHYIREYALNKGDLSEKDIEELLIKTKMDAIYITNSSGTVEFTNEKSAIGLNLYKVDQSFQALKEGKVEYVVTPIKIRVEDGKLFKFLTIADDKKRLYEVGLSLESLLS